MFRSSLAAFYSLLKCLFYGFADAVRGDRFTILFRRLPLHPEVEKIVHRTPEILFAAKVAFCSLHRDMPEQELNLLKLTAAAMTQLRTGPPQVVRCNVL
jgi:hypothetical protein